MMRHHTKLGVCIPTYKRPDQLRQCVNSIIASAADHAVPIFITDNSADATNQDVIAELQARYPHIIYELNPENVGIDRNVQRCINLCDCDYAWGMGDDDRMLPEAITTVLQILERESPAFLFANYSYVDENISVILREKLMPISVDKAENSATFFREDAWAIGFLGSCIINKKLWRGVQPEKYIGTYFAHVGVILESIAGQSVSLTAKPLVLNRVGDAAVFTWSDDAYGVFHGWSKVARLLEPIYGAEACAASTASFERNHGLNTLRFLMAKRADRIYTLDIYRKFIQGSEQGRLHKWAANLIARMPPFPFRGLRALFFFLRQSRNRRVTERP